MKVAPGKSNEANVRAARMNPWFTALESTSAAVLFHEPSGPGLGVFLSARELNENTEDDERWNYGHEKSCQQASLPEEVQREEPGGLVGQEFCRVDLMVEDFFLGMHQGYGIRSSEPVILQFENPVGVIERQSPLQERHWLELHGHCIRIAESLLVFCVVTH